MRSVTHKTENRCTGMKTLLGYFQFGTNAIQYMQPKYVSFIRPICSAQNLFYKVFTNILYIVTYKGLPATTSP